MFQNTLCVCLTVQTEIPVNVTYNLTNAGSDEMGQNALISWTYPVPGHVQYGWITLVYELQYRHVTESDNWKVWGENMERNKYDFSLLWQSYVIKIIQWTWVKALAFPVLVTFFRGEKKCSRPTGDMNIHRGHEHLSQILSQIWPFNWSFMKICCTNTYNYCDIECKIYTQIH